MLFDDLLVCLPSSLITELDNCKQSPIHHAEGSVLNHIKLVSQYLPDQLEYQLCAIFHDMGKLLTTRVDVDTGEITAIAHENFASRYIDEYKNLFTKIGYDPTWKMVYEICLYHMKAHLYLNGKMSRPLKRQKFESILYFNELIVFAIADEKGKLHR